MKKLLFLIFLVAAGAGGAYLAREGLLPGGVSDRGTLKRQSWRFLECLKFKDFRCAADFHSPDDLKANPNIPKLLEDFFLIPPENLDVQELRIDFVDLDSTGARAKVKATTTINVLNRKETRHPEVILYWKRDGERWHLDLRTTLERGGRAP